MSAPLVDLYQVDQFYVVEDVEHVARYWLFPDNFLTPPGELPQNYSVLLRNGTPITFTSAMNELQDILALFLSDTSTVNRADLYRVEANQQQRQFLVTYAPGASNGVIAAPALLANQTTLTYRTLSGRVGKFVIMETPNGNWGKSRYGPTGNPSSPQAQFAQYLEDPLRNTLVDREGTFGYAPINLSVTTNDALWKDRYGVG